MRRSLIAGAVLALALGACGSTAHTASKASRVSTLALVAGSPDAAADAGSARMLGKLTLSVDSKTRTVPIDGVVDFRSGASRLTMDLGALGLPGGGEIEARMVDGVMYMKMGDLFGGADVPSQLRDKQWVSMDLSELGADATGAGDSPGEHARVPPRRRERRSASDARRCGASRPRTSTRAVDVAEALDADRRPRAPAAGEEGARHVRQRRSRSTCGSTTTGSPAGSRSSSRPAASHGLGVDRHHRLRRRGGRQRAARLRDDGPVRADRPRREPRQLRHGIAPPVAWWACHCHP